jgi:ECF sigma factor
MAALHPPSRRGAENPDIRGPRRWPRCARDHLIAKPFEWGIFLGVPHFTDRMGLDAEPGKAGPPPGGTPAPAEALVALDASMARLAELNPRLGRVAECRFFEGMTEEEVTAALGVTERTVRRDWIKAKGWLVRGLGVASRPPTPFLCRTPEAEGVDR